MLCNQHLITYNIGVNFCVHDFPTSQFGLKLAIAGFMLLIEEAFLHHIPTGTHDQSIGAGFAALTRIVQCSLPTSQARDTTRLPHQGRRQLYMHLMTQMLTITSASALARVAITVSCFCSADKRSSGCKYQTRLASAVHNLTRIYYYYYYYVMFTLISEFW